MTVYLVAKFGGSSFTNDDSYLKVADHLRRQVEEGYRICVVVSAMSGTTGALSELLHSVCSAPRAQDRDAVLATGELLSCSLLRAALAEKGVPSKQLNAYQLGWTSNDAFSEATLLSWPSDAIVKAFEKVLVVVVCGGQAVTEDGEITMLGRNSSDLTAIVCAKALGVSQVRIYSDVEGFYTADPFKLNDAKLIPSLSYDLAKRYAQAGAKVLHRNCLAFAKEHAIRIECAHYCQATDRTFLGTVISDEGEGIQLIPLPADFLLWETADRITFEGWKHDCELRGVNYYESSQTNYRVVVNGKETSSLQWKQPHRPLGTDQCLLLVFLDACRTEIHLVATDDLEEKMCSIHAELISGKDLMDIERELVKARSRFSTIYHQLAQSTPV